MKNTNLIARFGVAALVSLSVGAASQAGAPRRVRHAGSAESLRTCAAGQGRCHDRPDRQLGPCHQPGLALAHDLTPPKGDYASVPLNPSGTATADTWDLARDNAAGEQCKAFGAPAIMRVPGRLRISWQDDMTLKLEFDAGQQTRLLRFSAPNTPPLQATGERTYQGFSTASWFRQPQRRGFVPFAPPGEVEPGGSLTVDTTNLKAGYLRKNGVPYSENARLKEYFDRLQQPDGTEWLVVTTVVTDPTYLRQPFVVATHFKKEPDGSKWNPQPCQTDPPVVDNFKDRPTGFR